MSQGATPSSPAASGQRMHPFEALLRLVEAAAPKPWYPRVEAASVGIPPELLHYYLENLWLDGLVQKAEGTPETGPGLTLTPLGRDVLDDPAALHRLCEGRPVVEGNQGGIVREAVRRHPRPTVTWALLAVNAAVFLYGLVLASSAGEGDAYLAGGMGAWPFLEKLGALLGGDAWLRGEWWRLATSCFIHLSVLHVLFTSLALYRIGARAEQTWGRGRFLLLYLLAGMGGNIFGLALQPLLIIPGPWGAVYGLLGANAVWVICNDRYLPRAVVSRMRTGLAIDAAMMALYLALAWLNRWTDLGGALTGVAVGLVLQVQRFGKPPWRWLVLAALVLLPWLGWTFINYERDTNPEWKKVNAAPANPPADEDTLKEEKKSFESKYIHRIDDEANKAYNLFAKEKKGVLREPPDQRDPDVKDKAKHDLKEQRDVIQQLEKDLTDAGPYQGEVTESARKTAVQFVQALDDLLTTAEKRLREGTEWTADDDAKDDLAVNAASAWYKLLK